MKTLPALLLLALAPACTPAPQPTSPKHQRFVFLAVLEGLYEEAFDPDLAKSLVADPEPDLFVVKCPLCEPVLFAFRTYAAQPRPRMYDFHEGALPPADREALKSPDRAKRLKALEAVVDRYVARKLTRTAMPEDQRVAFRNWAAEGRKFGMSIKRAGFGDYCPSCNGVNGKQ